MKIVFKHYLVHPQQGTIPAHAACAANLQGKFKPMYEAIWAANRNFTQENMEKIAAQLGLDMQKFKADMAGPCPKLVQQDQQDVGKVGTTGTPAFYINGRFLSGAQPIESFKALIDEELKKANERIAKGEATVETYFQKFVLDQGLKELAAAPAGGGAAGGGAGGHGPGQPGAKRPPGDPPPGKTEWSEEHGHWH